MAKKPTEQAVSLDEDILATASKMSDAVDDYIHNNTQLTNLGEEVALGVRLVINELVEPIRDASNVLCDSFHMAQRIMPGVVPNDLGACALSRQTRLMHALRAIAAGYEASNKAIKEVRAKHNLEEVRTGDKPENVL